MPAASDTYHTVLRTPPTGPFYKTIREMEAGNIQYPGNELATIKFKLDGTLYLAASIFAALEFLGPNSWRAEWTKLK